MKDVFLIILAVVFLIYAQRWEFIMLSAKLRNRLRILELIDELRGEAGSGHSVEVTCDNEEPETIDDQCQVICNGDWTTWEPENFRGRTVLDALQKAKFKKDCQRPEAKDYSNGFVKFDK